MAIQLPSKLAETGLKADHARAINQLIAGPGQRVEQNANGTTLKTAVMSTTVQTSEESWFY